MNAEETLAYCKSQIEKIALSSAEYTILSGIIAILSILTEKEAP